MKKIDQESVVTYIINRTNANMKSFDLNFIIKVDFDQARKGYQIYTTPESSFIDSVFMGVVLREERYKEVAQWASLHKHYFIPCKMDFIPIQKKDYYKAIDSMVDNVCNSFKSHVKR